MEQGMEDELVKDWRVTWTVDGAEYHERGFFTFESAQAFARSLVREYGSEGHFSVFAERMMVLSTRGFLDAESAGGVELAPHLLATAMTFA